MNSVQALVDSLHQHAPEAARRLNRTFSMEQALTALCIDQGKTVQEVAAQTWTVETLVEALIQCCSILELPQLLAVAEFDESIIPEGTERALLEEKVKHKGEIWLIHKYDADPFPSNPHAHNHESNLKLHLGTGDLYLGKKVVGSLSKKNFGALREKIKHVVLPSIEGALAP